MTELLHRLGYVYKKPKLVPGKADGEAQEAFLETCQKLKETKAEQDPIYFIDAAPIRIKIRWSAMAGSNAASTVALFRQLEAANPQAERIHTIADNARYYRSKEVSEYLKESKIDLIFLPPYSPNLNLIERFWSFFNKQVLYNQYYETLNVFNVACEDFFENSSQYTDQLRSLLMENFQIIRI